MESFWNRGTDTFLDEESFWNRGISGVRLLPPALQIHPSQTKRAPPHHLYRPMNYPCYWRIYGSAIW